MKLWKIMAVLCLSPIAWGQGVRFDSNVFTAATNVPPGAQATMFTVPRASIKVCAYPAVGSPCTNVVNIYSNPGLTTPITQPILTDTQGRFGFWAAPGQYTYSVSSANGKVLGTYNFSLAGAGGGTATFPGTPGIVYNLSASTARNATGADIGSLFTGTGPCFLVNDGTCSTSSAGVTSFAVGLWPSFLTPIVTNSTTTPTLAVSASAIPNSALANYSMNINGTICSLGPALCTVSGGGGGGGGSIASLTANYIPLATGPTSITAISHLDDGATTPGVITSTEPVTVNDGTGLGGGFDGTEGIAHSGSPTKDEIWADTALGRMAMNNHGAGKVTVASLSDLASSSAVGVARCDGTTISCSAAGVISVVATGTAQYIAPQAIAGCGVAYVSGLTYTVGACTYTINGVTYHSPITNVTLPLADPSNPRIDVIFVDTTQTAQSVQGTPAVTPQAPTVDPSTQLQLTFVLVPTGGTAPSNTTITNIYQEGVEWTGAVGGTNGSRVNLTSTNNPYQGTKDTEFGNGGTVTTTTYAQYVDPAAGTVNLGTYNYLIFYIRNKAAWPATRSITVQWFNGATAKGTAVVLSNGSYGFDAIGNTTAYQQIVIPASTFGISGIPVTTVQFTVSGSGSALTGFYLDAITLQGGNGGVILPTTLMNFRGAWSSTATYNPNDVVTSGGTSYAALITSTNQSVGTVTAWSPLATTGTGTVTNAAALTNNAVMIGQGTTAAATISADTTTTHALFATAGAPAFRAIAAGDIPSSAIPLYLNWVFNSGAAATDASPRFLASHTGTIATCYALTTASDGATALTFNIFDNGSTIFSGGAQTIAAGTAAGTLTTLGSLGTTSITNNDKISINITSGTSSWIFTVSCK